MPWSMGETGCLVKRGDVEGLGTTLGHLLLDPARRTLMGREGRRYVEEKFSYAALAERHEKWYLDAIMNRVIA